MNLSPLKYLSPELTLLASAPGVDMSMSGKHNKVVISRYDGREPLRIIWLRLDIEYRDGKELMFLTIRESKETFDRLGGFNNKFA